MKIGQNLIIAAAVVALCWLVYLIDLVLPVDLRMLGIRPRQLVGLWGIVFSPLLHGGLGHLLANSGALFVLLTLSLTYSRKLTVLAVIIILAVGGGMVWLLGGSNTVHIGSSGLIFGLIGFLLFAGIFRRDPWALIAAVAVFFLYGGVMLFGFIPRLGVSWTSHVFGFLAGVLAAYLTGSMKKIWPEEAQSGQPRHLS